MSITARWARSRFAWFDGPAMQVPHNTFKQAPAGGRVELGLWIGLADPCAIEAIEAMAGIGFDWMLIDGEHSPIDLRSVPGQLQAVAPYPSR